MDVISFKWIIRLSHKLVGCLMKGSIARIIRENEAGILLAGLVYVF
jgi:hypothetical protein